MRSFVFLLVLAVLSMPLSGQTVQVLETRADGSVLLGRSQAKLADHSTPAKDAAQVRVLPEKALQRMDGFGASLTGSSAELLLRLPESERVAAMHELFDPAGPLGLTLLRQPIGASDFSADGNYSYDDVSGDAELAHFSLGDDAAIFPLLREAVALNPSLRLMVLPWSAPAWMKTTHTMNGGALDERFLTPYAHYLDRTVKAYAQQGLPVYAMALQNEPENENLTYPTQLMPAKQEIALAAQVRPLLRGDGFPTLLLGYEHNWNDLDYPRELLTAPGLFDGISFHCYRGDESAQRTLLFEYPRTSVWFTECSGTNRTQFAGDLLWQAKHLLLGAPRNGARSVMLWNLVLDPRGGPHNGGCTDCRALLTMDKDHHLTRNVEFYVMAHAAPFVHPDAQQVETTGSSHASLSTTAYRNVDGTWVLLVLNSGPTEVPLVVEEGGKSLEHVLPARSLTTLSWGDPVAVFAEGLYRVAGSKAQGSCLVGVAGAAAAARASCSAEESQLWVLRRLNGGRFELRNLATAQDLTHGLALTAVDGDHVAPTVLSGTPDSFCVGEGSCVETLRLLPASAGQ